jgi:hypothetical protein
MKVRLPFLPMTLELPFDARPYFRDILVSGMDLFPFGTIIPLPHIAGDSCFIVAVTMLVVGQLALYFLRIGVGPRRRGFTELGEPDQTGGKDLPGMLGKTAFDALKTLESTNPKPWSFCRNLMPVIVT